MVSDINKKLNSVADYLNGRFTQDSEEYNIGAGAKPQLIKFDEDTLISTWACGAIVCIDDLMYFIEEDDGHWFFNRDVYDNMGCLNYFNVEWTGSFIQAMSAVSEYKKRSGS